MFDLNDSFEAVAFQRNNTVRPLIRNYFQEILNDPEDDINVARRLQEINDLIFDTTGILFESQVFEKGWFFGPYEISVVVPNVNALSPVNTAAAKRMEKLDIDGMKIDDVLNGKVDFKNGKVSGFFSTIEHQIKYSRRTFTDKHLTAEELTALHFHEVGHAWVNLVFLGESLATNVILAEIVGQYDMQTTAAKKFQVGRAALKMAGVNSDVAEDATSSDIVALVLKGQCDRMQYNAGTRWYDQRLAEVMSDQFSVRFGNGVDLAKALTKLERSTHIWGGTGYEPKWFGLMFNFMNVAFLPMAVVGNAGKAATFSLISSISKTFLTSFFFSGVVSEVLKKFTGGHPPIKDRLESIRREVLSELKNPKLPDDLRRLILSDLTIIDEEIGSAHPFTDVYTRVSRYLADVFVGRRHEMDKHKLVEDLANNRLYEFSAKLKG